MQNPSIPSNNSWTILTVLKWTANYFNRHGIDGGRVDAEVLLASILKFSRIDLYLHYDQPLTDDELFRFKGLIKQRVAREPVAYILGHKEFWSLDFIVTRNVLIPRPETECLVENVIECSKSYRNNHSLKILELGTGSGAIIVALASEMPFHFYTATDFSFEAIQIARQNALKLISEKKINWVLGDWLSPFKDNTAAFDIILSNPPYIKKNIIQELQPEIYRFEPIAALDGGEDGLDSLKQIIFAAANKLRPGGRLFLEIGYDQKNSIIQIARSCGCYEMPLFKKDYAGNNRIAILRLIS